MFNNLIIRHLIGFMIIKKRLLGVLLALFLSMQNRGVLQYFRMGCYWRKVLIFSVLNNIFTLEFFDKLIKIFNCISGSRTFFQNKRIF